ncbi:MAG: AraC family transcriptional regulator [Acidobacteriota bacterium]|nr:AraC family transcriptional regulator [Acidobacteriota bacterium]
MREVLEQLESEWRKQVRTRDLAATVNLGVSRLTHLIKESTDSSLRDLVRRRRIAEAAHLLVTTHRRISEICYEVGFSDLSNFNHTFRREHGVSPREYRQRERAKIEDAIDDWPR